MAVPAVVSVLVPIVVGIAKLLIKLFIQNAFEENRHHIPHDGIDILAVLDADIVFLQVLTHHFSHCGFLG